jgi:hypothetical protein
VQPKTLEDKEILQPIPTEEVQRNVFEDAFDNLEIDTSNTTPTPRDRSSGSRKRPGTWKVT